MALDRLQRELAFECPSIDGWNNGYLIIIGVLLSTFVVPVLARGSDCIDLWIRPGIIRFWLYRAGNHNNLGLPRRTNEYRMVGAGRWSMKSFTTNLKHRVRNCGYYFINVIPRTWMGSHEGLDTHSPSELLIRSQFLVTSKKDLRHALVGPHNYFFRDKYRRDDRVQESCYLRYLGGRSYEGMPKKDISHFLKSKTWVLSALWQVITPRNGAPLIPPAASQSGSSLSGGVLSVGSTAETGRSYLTDDLAVDFSATLVSISMGNLCETERYIMMIKSTKMKSNMKLLAFNLCRPITWSKLIEGMSSCIIWIRDMHKLDLRREEEFLGQAEIEIDTEFATRSVSISLDGLTDHAKSTIIVGSTYTPGEMDPSLIRPNRSDRLINVRMLSTPPRRQRRFPSIRPPRGYDPTMIKADGTSTHLNAFGYRVLRHARDLIALTHGVSAVGLCSRSISYRVNAVESIMIGQAIGEHDIYLDTVTNYSGYAYRTGRAVARSPVIGLILLSPSLGFPSCGGEMESPTFTRHTGCMHECEPPYVAGVAGEYAALARASGRLAGSAAHFWAVEESDSISFVRFTECDFAVVRAILDDSMLGEYNWSETHKGRFLAPTGSRFVDRHYSISIGSRLARERRKGGATLRATYNSESGNKYGNAMAIEETTARTHGKGPGKAPNEYWSKAAPDAAKYVPVGPSRAMKDKKTSRPPIHDAVDSITFQGSTWAHQMERDEGGMDGKIIYGPVLLMGKRFIWWHPWAHSEGCPFVGSPHSAKFISYEVGFMPEIGIDESEIVFHSRTADEFTMLMAVICEGNSMLDVAHRGKSIIVNQGSRSELAAGAQNIAAAERTIYGRTAALGTSEHTRLFYPTYMFQGWWLDVDPPTGTVARELPNPQERLGIGSLACGTPIQSVVIESHRYFFKGFSAGVAYPFGN
uniref:Hypothetical chloroplast RF2 n=1 Tax=Selaginella kraussiana TaxID=81964 RepID=A0A3Q9R3B3_9TRAC|nr:hypothetical chloroplast RF2 [Selaginella kraussiana]AZU95826.1 hypothetical chloroplast RF2 [Selaginella kraussiana]